MARLKNLTIASVVLAGVFVFTSDAQQARKDAQSSYEPRSDPGAGQKFLSRFAGHWTVVKTFYPRSGAPAVAMGECHQTMIHGGRFLRSEFLFHDSSGDTTGLGVIGFEADSGLFTSFWTDSRSTRVSIRHSEAPFDGKEIRMVSRTLDSEQQRRSRTLTHLEDDDRRIVHQQFVAGADGKERLIMQLVMTRKAESK